MHQTEYHKQIVAYYKETENAYKDSWDLDNSLSIHYGYWDEKVRSFPESLVRMNEVMVEAAQISSKDKVLDAGCGVGGSSIYLAEKRGCSVTGITLSQRQADQATRNAKARGVNDQVDFMVMDYCKTDFPDESFDVIWGCESICYADDKNKFIREAFRLLRPGGRLVMADGMLKEFENNRHPVIRKWLDGWQVNYLETPANFREYMKNAGFTKIEFRDISREVAHSSRRLNRFFYLANIYLIWKKINFSGPPTEHQLKNIRACKSQYTGLKKGLWQYGLMTGKKP